MFSILDKHDLNKMNIIFILTEFSEKYNSRTVYWVIKHARFTDLFQFQWIWFAELDLLNINIDI